MIDRLMCAKAKDDFGENYDPSQAVIDASLLNPAAPELVVIFPPWHGDGAVGTAVVNKYAARLANTKAVLRYRFHDRILESDIEGVVRSHQVIHDRVLDDLDHLDANYGYKGKTFVGISLGNVALAKVAGSYANFNSALLVTSANTLSDSVWEGRRTQVVRKDLEDQGIAQVELREAWTDLAPATHAAAFADKPVISHIAKADTIIPTRYQRLMADKIHEVGGRLKRVHSAVGHYATITEFCLRRGITTVIES